MQPLPKLRQWRDNIDPESTAQEMRWLDELIADADEAIAAQRRIIDHDGRLEAHLLALNSLEAKQKQQQSRLATLMESRDLEVLDFALDGKRYSGHRANAGVLSEFLQSLQDLYVRIGQAISVPRPKSHIPREIRSMCQLEVAGFYPSSFGVRFAVPTRSDMVGYSLTTESLAVTFDLLNAEHPIEQIDHVGPWAMRKYGNLVSILVNAEATPKVSWKTPSGIERSWNIDDHALLTLRNRLAKIHSEEAKILEAQGTLTGASLRRHRFEFVGGQGIITGAAPTELSEKITANFGKTCRIRYVETLYIDDTTEQQRRSRVLIDITPV